MYQFKEMQKISILTYFHFLRNLDTRLTNLLKGLYMGGEGGIQKIFLIWFLKYRNLIIKN